MKRIICTVTNDLTYDQRMIRICTSLANAGYQVRLVGRCRRQSQPLTHKPFEQKRLFCWFEQGKLFYLEYNIRLWFYLLFSKFDAVCAVDLDTILPGLLASKIKGKICIYDAHEYFTETPEVVYRSAVRRIWSWVARFAIPRVDAAYTVGESLAKIFTRKYNKPFEVIRNVPFRQTEIARNEKDTNQIILYQGVLNEGRGLKQAIEAMQFIDDAELWLAGEGDLSEGLRQLVHELDLQQKVRFLGYLQPEELKKITLQATIGLNLLENRGLSYYYSLANKAFDYIQAGLPSIQMNFPEYDAINRKHEVFILIDNLDIQNITTAIIRLLKDRNLYDKIKRNCLITKEIYIWEIEEKKLLEIYARMF